MAKKEKCPKCGSTDISVALDSSKKHYCAPCQHIWVPGLEGLKRTDVVLKQSQEENIALKAEVTRLRKENAQLKELLESSDEESDEESV